MRCEGSAATKDERMDEKISWKVSVFHYLEWPTHSPMWRPSWGAFFAMECRWRGKPYYEEANHTMESLGELRARKRMRAGKRFEVKPLDRIKGIVNVVCAENLTSSQYWPQQQSYIN